MVEQRVAIVTAAGRGIGAACARELAARGYRLALMARSVEVVALAAQLNRVGRPGSVTETAVAFLLSEEAGYITGQNVRVDGGMTRPV